MLISDNQSSNPTTDTFLKAIIPLKFKALTLIVVIVKQV